MAVRRISPVNFNKKPISDTFVNPDPAYLECTSNACRCKGTALMPFDNSDGSRRYFPFMGMNEEGSWVGFSAYARGTDKKNDGEYFKNLIS